nr:odorant receptor 26 [Achelura yunnanensis]
MNTTRSCYNKMDDLNSEKIPNYIHYIMTPLKLVGCWEWYKNPEKEYQMIINNVYYALVLFVLINLQWSLVVNLYTEWTKVMDNLEKLADSFPLLVSIAVIVHFTYKKKRMYELVDFMNSNFKYHSARGLTNMTMFESYKSAKKFGYVYTACTFFSISMYICMPLLNYVWTKQPIQYWVYADVTSATGFIVVFVRQCVGQIFVALAVGQLGVFFASNSILICGQLDILCCSLRNVRYTALLLSAVQHRCIAVEYGDIVRDEEHSYMYNKALLQDTEYHYDEKMKPALNRKDVDIYSAEYDMATIAALKECAKMGQVIMQYIHKFERLVSPLLVIRVVQVTLYLCILLYAASSKFDMVTVEYLAAVALDIFIYCYYGNQIIIQADRVTTAAYQSAWPGAGARARRTLLNLLLAHRRPVHVRAGSFLTMDLRTFLIIIKTSFSYYTLLVNVNENK